ncbi:hypothetical protein DESPIG_00448 [Desulfovibrio piger ATCC 29098]|uniref:Uncharacterized protein n=1 Tax=Desulfovibrio piger ATCC 29098 TaxID=411464 RepID=B6WQW8_9BACT|nr:hypothetical protein DESPIG_00448 [Desulfovibrio piger ATCC 29098]
MLPEARGRSLSQWSARHPGQGRARLCCRSLRQRRAVRQNSLTFRSIAT